MHAQLTGAFTSLCLTTQGSYDALQALFGLILIGDSAGLLVAGGV